MRPPGTRLAMTSQLLTFVSSTAIFNAFSAFSCHSHGVSLALLPINSWKPSAPSPAVAAEVAAVHFNLLLVLLVGGEVVPTLDAMSEASLDLGVGRREELVVDGEMEADEASVPSTVVVGVS